MPYRFAWMLAALSLAACSKPAPEEGPDAGRAATLALARSQIAHYQFQPPAKGDERCFDLKVIVRTLRSAEASAAQAEWHRKMQSVCTAAGKSTDL